MLLYIFYRSVLIGKSNYYFIFSFIVILLLGSISIFRNSIDTKANDNSIVTVKSGDTLENLSDRYNVFISMLEKTNNKYDDNQLLAGDHLLLPLASGDKNDSKPKAKNNDVKVKKESTQKQQTVAKESEEQIWNQANADAKAWISFHESTDSYTAQNGQYYGRYQLDRNYLAGDYSPDNQERVANQYVSDRYGSWVNAKAHWEANNWY
ncbi:LysM peptidoglycan-binding domain-containing protein [Apilactobacillus apisilvae]|uniref:LysM peptidoglycan-binding domain-containing protein n=1 Tax=Apilactobacillus apisilvae TaxID=2923364 RepID=A0ABY4PGB9_9LACO|nr:LysM peptidoglycan-binding domain-containing protein [Apilactobacillus apisilvae]UQS84538.1 LysM peptidoglycan-binding domain-containing protein [Apilactobacillus apisilvae]